MPTIIAICPYCRAGGVRAPDTAIGASANCPKCKSSFTVVPSDDIPPDWDRPVEKPRSKPKPLEETLDAAAVPDVTEPSPVLPAEPRAKEATPSGATSPAPAPVAREHEPVAPPDMGLVFALVALILVGPAMLLSQVPYGRVIGLAVILVGLVAGVLALLGGEGRAKPVGGVAIGLHLVGAVFLLFLPGWLGLDEWRGAPPEESKGPVMVEHGSGLTAPLGADPLDASRYSWQGRDAQVTLRASVGPVELHGPDKAKRATKEHYLHLNIQVRNAGFEQEIPLTGWAAGHGTEGVRVTDSGGKTLAPASFEAGWAPGRGRPAAQAMPGHASEVVLVFAAPPAKSDSVRVQLPGAALGATEEIRFRAAVSAPPGPRVPGK